MSDAAERGQIHPPEAIHPRDKAGPASRLPDSISRTISWRCPPRRGISSPCSTARAKTTRATKSIRVPCIAPSLASSRFVHLLRHLGRRGGTPRRRRRFPAPPGGRRCDPTSSSSVRAGAGRRHPLALVTAVIVPPPPIPPRCRDDRDGERRFDSPLGRRGAPQRGDRRPRAE